MQPLLSQRSRSMNESNYHDMSQSPRHYDKYKYWDEATVTISLLRHLYCVILMYYYWETGNAMTSIGQIILILYFSSSLGAIICAIGFIIIDVISDQLMMVSMSSSLSGALNWIIGMFLGIMFQPGFILFVFIHQKMRNNMREWFYFTIFVNILFNGLPIYLALCYYLVSHPANYFNPTKLDQLLIIIYFILFFLSILTIYPIFAPLQSMNKRHLLFKLSCFSLQIIRALFTGFLMVSYYFSIISVNDNVQYIYDLYLMRLFGITPILCIWTVLYIVDWRYFEIIGKLIQKLKNFTLYRTIFLGLCWIVLIIVIVFIYPLIIILPGMVIIGIYWWIIFECWSLSIIDSFIFTTSVDMMFNGIVSEPNLQISIAWKAIHEYLTNINDSISYKERLYILKYLSRANSRWIRSNNQYKSYYMKAIILNQDIEDPLLKKRHGFICYFVKHFLKLLVIYGEQVLGEQNIRENVSFGILLHVYDFNMRQWEFKWKHSIYIIWELCCLFIILPLFVISIIIVTIILPLVLLVMYFYVFTQQHSFTFYQYLSDFKLCILFIYLLILFVAAFTFIEEYKLINIWYHCQFLHIDTNNNHLNKENIRIYHNHIHEYKMIYNILTTFFGELGVTIMEYVGIISDGSLNILSLNEYSNANSTISHRNTVACNAYLFQMATNTE